MEARHGSKLSKRLINHFVDARQKKIGNLAVEAVDGIVKLNTNGMLDVQLESASCRQKQPASAFC